MKEFMVDPSDVASTGGEVTPAPDWDVTRLSSLFPHLTRRRDLLHLIRPGGIGVELGVAEGYFSEALLKHSALGHLYSIDMYAGDRGHDVEEYKRALRRLMPYRHRNSVLKMTFTEALDLFPDRYFDFIYVDGYAHTGEEGGTTFDDWLPKLKPGGILGGHDYNHRKWPLVVQAVNQFIAGTGLPLHIINDTATVEWNQGSPSWFTIVPLLTEYSAAP